MTQPDDEAPGARDSSGPQPWHGGFNGRPAGEAPGPGDVIDSEVAPGALGHVLDFQVAWQFRAIPMRVRGSVLTVGMVAPDDAEALAGLKAATRYELDVLPLDAEVFENLYASTYPDSVFVDGHRRLRANPRLLRAVQEAGGLVSTSSEFLGWGLLIVFIIAGIGIFYYFAQTLVLMVLHFVMHPIFLLAGVLLLISGFLFLRLVGERRR